MSEGKKDDTGKLDWDAIPLEVLESVVPAFVAGLEKYERHNCAQQFDEPRRRFFSAMMRHAKKCQMDPMAWNEKDGCSHASSMAFNAIMFCHHCCGIVAKPVIVNKDDFGDFQLSLFEEVES